MCSSLIRATSSRRRAMANRSSSPLLALIGSRVKLFSREPAAIFWVYGFPIVMMAALGAAFREDVKEEVRVDLVSAQVEDRKSKAESQAEESAPRALLV